ncbi:MAG: UDP-N-acetylmuramate:L-alanyl-gamma-D-glutamyl-meso-diaminopimelate ligase [Deltaproteobacteria bacterium]|nr:UDP-N-acetylmuramate:L-alanyl-gamma-D-glutamyl-meso-diaminopimelate ligase [Deltaproteobacteria bacterium]
MGSLACLLREAGYAVTGSDHALYPPMSDILAAAGIVVREGFDPSHIDPDVDLVVIGNAVSRTNAEAVAAAERGLRLASFPSALEDLFLGSRHPVVVAGTHGKTTTTSMTAWLLESAGQAPGFLIGGSPANFSSGARLGSGAPFVIEGDEYDTAYFDKGPKFLHYRPRTAIVGNVEFDHADIYADLEAVVRAFEAFARLVPADGRLLLHEADPHTPRLTAAASARVETVGRGEGADWRIVHEASGAAGTTFQVVRPAWAGGDRLGPFVLDLAGEHNVTNATFAIAACHSFPIAAEKLVVGLAGFEGVKRRLEVVGEARGVTVIDDFAHHPTAVTATLGALRGRYPGSRLWVVFEPRSATSRRAVFQDGFASAFAGADRVVLAPLWEPHKIPEGQRLDVARMVSDIERAGTRASTPGGVDEIVAEVAGEAKTGDVVTILSSGGFGGIHHKLLAALAGTAAR